MGRLLPEQLTPFASPQPRTCLIIASVVKSLQQVIGYTILFCPPNADGTTRTVCYANIHRAGWCIHTTFSIYISLLRFNCCRHGMHLCSLCHPSATGDRAIRNKQV